MRHTSVRAWLQASCRDEDDESDEHKAKLRCIADMTFFFVSVLRNRLVYCTVRIED